MSVCLRCFREELLTFHVKIAEGIIMKFHIWIRCLLTYVYSYIFDILTPKESLGVRTNENDQITPKLLTLRQILLSEKL